MAVTLRNVAAPPRPLDLHLPHEIVCAAAGECFCVRLPAARERVDPATKRRTSETFTRRVPGTITLQARGTKGAARSGLPDAVARAPEIASAIARREVALTSDAVAPVAEASTTPQASSTAATEPPPPAPMTEAEAPPPVAESDGPNPQLKPAKARRGEVS